MSLEQYSNMFASGFQVRTPERGQGMVASTRHLYQGWKHNPSLTLSQRLTRVRQVLGDRARAKVYLRRAEVGVGIRVSGKPRIVNQGTLRIGDDCTLRSVT